MARTASTKKRRIVLPKWASSAVVALSAVLLLAVLALVVFAVVAVVVALRSVLPWLAQVVVAAAVAGAVLRLAQGARTGLAECRRGWGVYVRRVRAWS